jgi:hypothetical protein
VNHLRKLATMLLGLALIGGMLSAASASPKAVPKASLPARFSPGSIRVLYRGMTPPLSDLAVARSVVPHVTDPGYATDSAHFRQLNAHEADGVPPIIGWTVPTVPSLPISMGKGILASFNGQGEFETRYSAGGNQFSSEPPDQGLCASGTYELETTNDVMQVYDKSGNALLSGNKYFPSGPPVGLSLTELYQYPDTFVRPSGPFGPFLTDPSCSYDAASGRWFHLVLSLGQRPGDGAFTGRNWLDLAVSTTSNPLGRWNLYKIWTQNDGTQATPNHNCDAGPCIGDYPHFAVNAGGMFITTNEYAFFGNSYSGAQLYAIDKASLMNAGPTTATYFENLTVPSIGQKAFTMWPSSSTPQSFVGQAGGVEYFLSSTAGDGSETGNFTRGSDRIVVWALTGTSHLSSSSNVRLLQTVVPTEVYTFPPKSLQRPGPTPLLRCINQGVNCLGAPAPFKQTGPYPLDSNDTRMQSGWLEHGVLWGTLDTGIQGSGGSDYTSDNNFAPTPVDTKAGVAYFAFAPQLVGGNLEADVLQQGYMAVDGNNLTYPSLAMGGNNTGIVGATLVGPNRYPSAVFIRIGLGVQPTAVSLAARGTSPSDGFSGTWQGGFRPRWGDYGAATTSPDGSIWFGAEYVNSRCDYAAFLNDTTCGFTRAFFGNYSTRLTRVTP